MDSSDKFKVIEVMRALRPIAENYEKDKKEGMEALRDDKYESMQEKVAKHNDAINKKSIDGLLSSLEYHNAEKYFAELNKQSIQLVESLNEKEVDVSYDKISKDAVSKLFESNDFDADSMTILYDVLV